VRQVVLDTETTGLEAEAGHRVIEIGAVEVVDRRLTGRRFHRYLNPERDIDDAAMEVHGISDEFLLDKPKFAEIAAEFVDFVQGAELVIHNAGFDVSFLDQELARVEPSPGRVGDLCAVTDSLTLARHKHPGQKNNLDALCRRYDVDNSHRDLHGALLDAEILADVYLAMTGGQTALFGDEQESPAAVRVEQPLMLASERPVLTVVRATTEELDRHEQRLADLDAVLGAPCVWRRLGGALAPSLEQVLDC
jgi:DNA polymerase-3 subunit epsilon